MVGAGRFERPIPCAQGSQCVWREVVFFHVLLFQAVVLNSLEDCCPVLRWEALNDYNFVYIEATRFGSHLTVIYDHQAQLYSRCLSSASLEPGTTPLSRRYGHVNR